MSGAYDLVGENLSEDVERAIAHLIRIFEKFKIYRIDPNLWGDEMEYILVNDTDFSKVSLQGEFKILRSREGSNSCPLDLN